MNARKGSTSARQIACNVPSIPLQTQLRTLDVTIGNQPAENMVRILANWAGRIDMPEAFHQLSLKFMSWTE